LGLKTAPVASIDEEWIRVRGDAMFALAPTAQSVSASSIE
jgi:hypothetical protein